VVGVIKTSISIDNIEDYFVNYSCEVGMVDDLDIKLILIRELQRNGRETYVNLAKKLMVVEGTIRKRVKDLLEKNIIEIVALPNLKNLDYNFIGIMEIQGSK
jgi:Lrp/AsnC family transcriptional regulator for asnA, asnC and gidA